MSVTKKFRSCLVFFLIFTLLSSVILPYGTAFASLSNPGEGMSPSDGKLRPSVPELFPSLGNSPKEIIHKRIENSRTFLKPDGTISVEVFSQPVFWKNHQGRWIDIDNNIVPSSLLQAFPFQNGSNDVRMLFAKDLLNQAVNRIQYQDLYVEFVPQNTLATVGVPSANEITYPLMYPSVDMKYTVRSRGIKEDIILKDASAQNTFSFIVHTQGVTPKLNPNGTISFHDSKGKEVFRADKPFAFDHQENFTDQVTFSLTQNNDQWKLDVTLDQNWLKDPSRSFPITIDPTITFQPDDANVKDTTAVSGYPDTNTSTKTWVVAGTNANGQNRAYLWFNLPAIYSGASIQSASLDVYQYLTETNTDTVIDAHRIVQAWTDTTLTWNNKPDYAPTALSSKTDTATGWWAFDATSAVKGWYDGKLSNYGLMLKARDETTNRRAFYSSENADPKANPKLTINYIVDPTGAEDFWSHAGNVNVHSGNLLLLDVDVELPGKGVPIQVTRSYSSRSTSNPGTFGYGWQLNTGMSLSYSVPYKSKVVVLTDADGTKHVFTEKDGQEGVWEAPPGVDLGLKYQVATATDANAYFIVTDKSQTKYYFEVNTKRLEAVIDSNGNVTDLAYNTDGTLAKVSDASGRIVNFNYSSGKLDSLTGNEITTVKYGYNSSGDLVSMSKLSSTGTVLEKVAYGYDGYHNVTSITDSKGAATSINYYTTDRVSQISNNVTVDGVVTTYTTSYGYSKTTDGFSTKVTDPKGVATLYTTNGVGNVIEVVEDYGTATSNKNIKTSLHWDQKHHLVKEVDPRTKETVFSYGKNGNVEKINNHKNQSQTMKFDPQNNLLQFTDFGGETEKDHYDTKSNNVASVNVLAGTEVNENNSAGDVILTTNPISLGDNIVVNNGFEEWGTSLPVHWSKVGSTGTIAQGGYDVNGDYSVRMDSTGSTDQASLMSTYLPVNGNTKYNISWFVRASNLSGNAHVKVNWYEGTTYLSAYTLTYAKGMHGWIEKGGRVTSPSNATNARIVLTVDTGTAWFDNVQMEEGTYVNDLNLVVNDSFETDEDANGKPDVWDIQSSSNTASDGIDLTMSNSGTNSLLLNGADTLNKYFGQNIGVSGEAGTMLSFSGSSYATGVSSTGGDYMLLLRADFTDGTTSWYGLSFSKSDHTSWEYKERSLTLAKDFKNLGIYAKYQNQTGKAWFDDVKLRTVGVSTAIMSEYNIAQNGSFEVDLDGNAKADGWIENIQANTTATMTWEKGREKTYIGDRAVSITNSGGWATYVNKQVEPIDTGKTYTASVMVKTEGVTTGGAILEIVLYDANGAYLTQKVSKTIAGTTDWTRLVLSLSESEAKALNTNAAKMKIGVGTPGKTTGTVHFDAVRWQSQSVTSNISYDAKGNYVTSVTDPLQRKTSYQTDARGNITKIDFPIVGSYLLFGYDALDRTTYEENATKLGIVYKYDANDNVTQVDYQNNGTGTVVGSIVNMYNELDQLTKNTDPNGNATVYKYDPNGNLTEMVHPNTKAISFGFDSLDRLTSTSYTGDSTTWSYAYDKNSNITKVVKNGTEVTDITIDPDLNQVQKVTFPTVNTVRNSVTYGYHPSGQIKSVGHSLLGGTIQYEYDHSGRMAEVKGINGQASFHMYDEAGRLKKTYTSDGSQAYNTYFNYNEVGLLSGMRQETASGVLLLSDTFLYDANGNRTETRHKDGKKEIYTYDLPNRLLREQYVDAAGTVTLDIVYDYDVMGNRISRTVNGTKTSYGYDKANQMTSVNSTTLSYDANGNTTSDGSRTYAYNAENQLISAKNSSGTVIAQYEYNHEGQRTKKVSGGVTELYYYNAGHLAYITDETNKLRYSFTRNAAGQLLTMTDHTGTSPVNYFYVLNDHGDVVGLRDSSGVMVVSYGYEAFGRVIKAEGTATTGDGKSLRSENPFRYASYVYDEETFLYYLNDRYYRPLTGRFLTRDEIPGDNRYVYVENNPIQYVDPDGYIPVLVWWIAQGAITAWSAYDTYTSLKKDPSRQNQLHHAQGMAVGGRGAKAITKGTVKHGPKYSTKTYNQWYQGTFKNKTESIDYHIRMHGNGRTPEQYTQAAMSFFSKNKHLAQEITLSTGKKGYKIQTGTGKNKVGGFWTKDGKIVTFWD
jgi:RHS repeat-associated protein